MKDLISALKSQATMRPDAPFLGVRNQTLTYRAFWDTATAVSEKLSHCEVEPGARVALIADNPIDCFTTLFGAWIHGSCVTPMNPSLPWESTRAVLDELRPNIVFSSKRPNLPLPVTKWFLLDDVPDISSSGHEDVIHPLKQEALIQFTSGTTGEPKGVRLSLASLSQNSFAAANAIQLSENDRLLINTPAYYMSALAHFFAVLHTGAFLFLESGFLFGKKLGDILKKEKCTGFGGAPTHLDRWVNTMEDVPPDLRFWISSGAPLSKRTHALALEKFPGLQIFSFYGLTEVGGRLCLLRPEDAETKLGAVGKPILKMKVQVCNEKKKVLPKNKEGQVHVSGPLLMKGYLNQPNSLDEMGFATGDLGYYDSDGFLWLTGRKDAVFKSGAEKVSTRLIETALMETELCKEVAVIGIDNAFLGKVPHAFIVPDTGFHRRTLMKELRARIPASHLPKGMTLLKQLPRTGSGKVKLGELSALLTPENVDGGKTWKKTKEKSY